MLVPLLILCFFVAVLCDTGSGNIVPDRCSGDGPSLLPNSYLFTLENQGFPGHPGALVYVPSTFRSVHPQISLHVWIHGYHNCISNIVRAPELACNCTAGEDVREGYNLIAQFEEAAAAAGSENAIFVAAEVAYDEANDSPGRWSETGMFKAYVDELLKEHMSPILLGENADKVYTSSNVSYIQIFSHSGGYFVIADMWAVGSMQGTVRDLVLFDSLYAAFSTFDAFVQTNLPSFGLSTSAYRFSSLYTADGGTYDNNVAMAQRAQGWVADADANDTYYWDNQATSVDPAVTSNYSLVFKLTNLTHDDIPRTLFGSFLLFN